MADQKLNLNINLGEIRYLKVPDITDYKLELIIQKFKIMDSIWRIGIIKINKFGLNSVRRFSRSLVLKLEKSWFRKITVTLFLTKFNLRLVINLLK